MRQHGKNIILVGMMGTGKSTVARLLAEQLGYSLVDLDAAIVDSAGSSIPEIFAEKGETYFRDLESEVLEKVLQSDRQIIATGGGVVLRPANRERMLEQGWVVALQASADVIVSRVGQDSGRPLLAGDVNERVKRILEERKDAYDFAHLTIDTSTLSVEKVAQQILAHYRV
ncbi:shikimate kinase [Paenibacillus sediminis]|uniref:Shikimate kinase n=1 Tax=Paenibacillus sediminis TaxID=664909 RepID=A0ABS4GZ27_9BACL|nr:shikimate kinase [Paenibacillus sediminis]MBP1935528.1 shikimate kinase [Paenibacillus sediminis]